jgi:hypothetical protein
MRKFLVILVLYQVYRLVSTRKNEWVFDSVEPSACVRSRASSTLACNHGTLSTTTGTEFCVCDAGWYTVPEDSPHQCACNVNCSPTGTKICFANNQTCICQSGYTTTANQNPKTRVYCNLQQTTSNQNASSGGNNSQSSSSGLSGFSFSGLNLSTILLALACLGIGAVVLLFCCCLGASLMSRARAY